jgi:hypothetical protein
MKIIHEYIHILHLMEKKKKIETFSKCYFVGKLNKNSINKKKIRRKEKKSLTFIR